MRTILRCSVILSCCLCGGVANADPILDLYGASGPIGHYEYSSIVGAGHGNSNSFVPTKPEIDSAIFRGYVEYPTTAGSSFYHQQGPFFNEDTIRVYRAYITSDTDVTIPMQSAGDDGYSIYLDGVFTVGIAGFSPPVQFFSINLTAGVPLLFEGAIYNGPGGTHLTFLRSDDLLRLESTPGVHVTGVPEPATWSLLMLGSACLAVVRLSRSRRKPSGA